MVTITRHDFLDPQRDEQRVLVVVFLRGGADGLTLVPPTGDDAYHRARPYLAVKAADAIRLDGYFSLHPDLKPLAKHFESGELAILHGAGSEDRTRSHFEAQDFMEHGGTSGAGWLGRYLRAHVNAAGRTPSALSAVAIGTTLPESLRGAPGGAVMQAIADFSFGEDDPQLIEALRTLYAAEAGPLGRAAVDTIDAVTRLRELRSRNDPPSTGASYPDSTFGRGLREIARLIKADVGLVATTIDLDGWDTHFVQSQLIGSLMTDLASGLNAFVTDLGDLRHRVTVVTMTEFGRRVRENTSFGTDHGLGSIMFLLGDGLDSLGGGRVTSGWRNLSDAELVDVGDVPAAINYRDVLAPVLLRHSPGIDLAQVFPAHQLRPVFSA